MGPTAGLDGFLEEKISWPWRDSNPDRTTLPRLTSPVCVISIISLKFIYCCVYFVLSSSYVYL